MANTTSNKNSNYNDFWVKVAGSLVASEVIDALGRKESIFRRITTAVFYTDLLGGFVISLALWEIVRYVINQLDKKFDWFKYPFFITDSSFTILLSFNLLKWLQKTLRSN